MQLLLGAMFWQLHPGLFFFASYGSKPAALWSLKVQHTCIYHWKTDTEPNIGYIQLKYEDPGIISPLVNDGDPGDTFSMSTQLISHL